MRNNKYEEVDRAIISKMLELANASYTYDELVQRCKEDKYCKWFDEYTLTTEQYAELKKFAVDIYAKKLRTSRKYAEIKVGILLLDKGFGIKDNNE